MRVMRFGLDLGAAQVHAVMLDGDGQVAWTAVAPAEGKPLSQAARLLDLLNDEMAPAPSRVRVGLTGTARYQLIRHLPAAAAHTEVVASARGAAALCPTARSVIEIGGQSSRWMALDGSGSGDPTDFALSDLCAAGAGSFLEQQAGRMQLGIEDLADLAANAKRGAKVAGRCAVFAKTDMIHLQQKGTATDEIAYGLCLSLARNFQARILRGRPLSEPVALVGGCAANAGLVRALQHVLELSGASLLVPELAAAAGAVGAALLAGDSPIEVAAVHETVQDCLREVGTARNLPPLPDLDCDRPLDEPSGEGVGPEGVILGVDVGSVSTDLVLLGPEGGVLDAIYLPTRSDPLAVLSQAMDQLAQRHGEDLLVLGVGVTGSGRHLAGRLLGADLVRNEITSQLRSSAAYHPEVDTVLEIGGQDAKYIHARDGHIVDFAMNRICAAGTGSFLEEQAERLGVAIVDEFSELALASAGPPDLGRRCTVFMESEMVHAMQQGASTSDVAAGLALSVVRNYLDRVVGGRPIGDQVLFQGGTASNRSVVAAFQQVLGRPVKVHPYNRISGAIGAALLVLDARADGLVPEQSSFRGMGACQVDKHRTFVCSHCTNNCHVNRFVSAGDVFYFGDICERWMVAGTVKEAPPDDDDLIARRNRALVRHAGLSEAEAVQRKDGIGVPRASLTWSHLPLWTALIRAMGKEPVLSGPSSSAVLDRGLRHLPGETCLPVKMCCGQLRQLSAAGLETLWLPSVVTLPPSQHTEDLTDVCPYIQHLPFMVEGTVEARILSPDVRLDRPPERVFADPVKAQEELGINRGALESALRQGAAAMDALHADLLNLGREVLETDSDRIVVLVGKPYNLADRFLNLDLARHLRRLGLPLVTMDCLPLHNHELGPRWRSLPWALNRDQVRAAMFVMQDPRLFPIFVSSFGCGTDGFTAQHLEHLLQDRPRLTLEMDEHRAEAGLVTRLEAFADEVDAWLRDRHHRAKAKPPKDTPVHRPRAHPKTWVVYCSDHAHVFAGALRRKRTDVVLLPPPDDEVRELGEEVATGRECHPYAMLAGDAIRLARAGELQPGDSFFYPGTVLPCLLTQYREGILYALERAGVRGINLETPDFKTSLKIYGLPGVLRLNHGIALVNLLHRAVCERRPYVADRQKVEAVHQRTLVEIAEAVERGDMHDAVRRGLADLADLAADPSPRRPIVGVAGDVYTRINSFASGNLIGRLEDMGCEVWPAPFGTDVIDANASLRLRRFLEDREPWKALAPATLKAVRKVQDWLMTPLFEAALSTPPEPSLQEACDLAAPYVSGHASPLVLLNIAKMVQYARSGVSGLINASCFNCMMGSVSAALVDRLARDFDGLPMTNLVYGGSLGTSETARVEAFVHQVHRYHERHGPTTTRAQRPGLSTSPVG